MATIRLIPSTIYNAAGTSYLTITNEGNAYANTDSTTYATIQNTNASTSNRYIYIRGFNFNAVPSNATVNSFTIKLKAYETGGSTNTNYRPYLCNDTTTINGNCGVIGTSTQTLTFTGVTTTWDTIKGYGANFGIRINCRRNSRNTAASFYIYGAEILVDYTVPMNDLTITNNSSTITTVPAAGTTSVVRGTSPTVALYNVSDLNSLTITDNNTDVKNSLVYYPAGSSAITLNPANLDEYHGSAAPSNPDYSYADTASTTHTDLNTRNWGAYLLYSFNIPNIPDNATISSVSCQVKARVSGTSNSIVDNTIQFYSGGQAKGTAATLPKTTATTFANTTVNGGTWTAEELKTLQLRVGANYSGGSNYYIHFYGANLTINYNVANSSYVYTISNISADHTIIISDVQRNKMHVKVNGSWKEAVAVYKKINSSWVSQTDLTNVFDPNQIYVRN